MIACECGARTQSVEHAACSVRILQMLFTTRQTPPDARLAPDSPLALLDRLLRFLEETQGLRGAQDHMGARHADPAWV
jgi:hypothetical protein